MSSTNSRFLITSPWKIRAFALVYLLLVALLGSAIVLAALSGGAAAANVEVTNTTVTVDNETSSVWVDVENLNGTNQANVTLTWVGIENGTETVLNTRDETVAANTSILYEQAVDGTVYDEVRVEVVLDDTTVPESDLSVSVGVFQKLEGGAGGGGLFDGMNTQQAGLVLSALGGAYLLFMRD